MGPFFLHGIYLLVPVCENGPQSSFLRRLSLRSKSAVIASIIQTKIIPCSSSSPEEARRGSIREGDPLVPLRAFKMPFAPLPAKHRGCEIKLVNHPLYCILAFVTFPSLLLMELRFLSLGCRSFKAWEMLQFPTRLLRSRNYFQRWLKFSALTLLSSSSFRHPRCPLSSRPRCRNEIPIPISLPKLVFLPSFPHERVTVGVQKQKKERVFHDSVRTVPTYAIFYLPLLKIVPWTSVFKYFPSSGLQRLRDHYSEQKAGNFELANYLRFDSRACIFHGPSARSPRITRSHRQIICQCR